MNIIQASAPVVMWLVLITFNVAIVKLLQVSFGQLNLKEVLREKALPPSVSAGAAGAPASDNTSYSRVAGMVGAVVLACFFWALGDVIIYLAFANPAEIPNLLEGLGAFVLSGTALFAPYAVNRLSGVFK